MMKIAYSKAAIRALSRMPATTATRIRAKIARYAADPASMANNVKPLKGRDGFRLRVGDYRVIFDQDGTVMAVLAIGHRSSIYED